MTQEKELPVYLTCKDHTVSGEKFQLLYDKEYDMLITSPKPSDDKLPSYYKSEDYISHTDAKRGWFEKAYHLVKTYALKQKIRNIDKFQPKKGRLLDIGAGTGDFVRACQKNGWDTIGVEPNEQARTLANNKGAAVQPSTSNLLPSSFDVITMWHVLEHVPDLQKQIEELKRLIKPKGSIFIAVPNFKAYDAERYKEFWAAYDVPRHLWHFSPSSIEQLFSVRKMNVIKTLPMKFDAFYVSLLSEKYKSGKMKLIQPFLTGLWSNWKARTSGAYSSLIYVIQNDN